MRRIPWLGLLPLLPLVTGCTPKPTSFPKIAEEFVLNSLTFSPSAATAAGYHRHNGVPLDELLDDFSPPALERQRAFYARFAAALERDFDPKKLSLDDAADLRVVNDMIGLARFDLEQVEPSKHSPQLYAEAIGNALFVPYTSEYAPHNKRFYDILKRLERVPARLAQAQSNLVAAPRVWTEVAAEETQGNIDLVALLKRERPAEVSAKFDTAADAATAALRTYKSFLEKDLIAHDRDWRLGKEPYTRKFQLTLGSKIAPAELLAAAEAELRHTREEMARLAGWQGAGDFTALLRARLDRIAKKHTTAASYFADAKRDLAESTAFVKARNLLPLPMNSNLAVIETPAFMRGIYSVGGFNPAPVMDPALGAQYWLTPIPAAWAAERVESKLREYNFYGLKILTIHEAMPGHYVQFEAGNRIEPRGRRLLRGIYANGAYVEGWAVYATQTMIEEGYLDGDPDLRLTFLKQQLRMISNAILDIRLHTGGMTDAEAMRLMIEDTFQEKEEAEGKLRRAKLSSVQLVTYFAGWRDHVRMRELAKKTKGAAFNLAEYHSQVLATGALPIAAVAKMLTGRELPD